MTWKIILNLTLVFNNEWNEKQRTRKLLINLAFVMLLWCHKSPRGKKQLSGWHLSMFTSYEGNNCILFTDTCFNQLRRCCLYSSDSLQRQHFIRFVCKCQRTEVQINYIFSDKVRILSVSLPGLPVLYISKPDTSLVTINTCIQKVDSVLLTVRLQLYSWSTIYSLKILTPSRSLWEQFWIRTYFGFGWIWTVIVEMAELAVRKMCLRCLPTFIFSCWLKK
jgi:hypothetical protein